MLAVIPEMLSSLSVSVCAKTECRSCPGQRLVCSMWCTTHICFSNVCKSKFVFVVSLIDELPRL